MKDYTCGGYKKYLVGENKKDFYFGAACLQKSQGPMRELWCVLQAA
jgi:hypothetical protein